YFSSTLYLPSLFFFSYSPLLYLLSFPTRRSSDLFHRFFFLVVEHMSFTTRLRLYSLIVIPPSLPTNKLFVFSIFLVYLLDYYSQDRKSTRLNSSHVSISYAVFCLKKKKIYIFFYY